RAVAVSGPIKSLTVLNHPRRHASAVRATTVAHETVVPIPCDEVALYRARFGKKGVEGLGGSTSTWIIQSICIFAELAALRRVDSVKADALTVDFDRVTVHNRCRPHNGLWVGGSPVGYCRSKIAMAVRSEGKNGIC
ncbi:hypothetical protein, partial [Mesorhizobium sp. ORS 3428]|uniref:hypothetical protein n=1 Tax=Mesorhizobium sp. ORS 3428 TaxID=540997 RepID=UPI001AED08D6